MSAIVVSLQTVRQRITAACTLASRGIVGVALLAVSKTFDADTVRAVHVAGQRFFGESYVQEGIAKIDALTDLHTDINLIRWHFIGPLQNNKMRAAVEQFDWVHSVDRLKIIERLLARHLDTLLPLQVYLEINISRQASKYSLLSDFGEVLVVTQTVSVLPRLQLRDLMAMPEPSNNPTAQHKSFADLCALVNRLHEIGIPLDTLPMGMFADLEDMVAGGATIVCAGSAILGVRRYAHA